MRHWHVILTLSGESVEPAFLKQAVQRLGRLRPFLDSVKVTADTAEVQYWDEGVSMLDVASLALRLWNEYRATALLPNWQVVGLEVVEREVWVARESHGHPVQSERSALSPGLP